MESPDEVFKNMVTKFNEKENKNESEMIEIKKEMIKMLYDYCNTTTPENIYHLKQNLELNFSKKVKCKYCYLNTPVNYGCDLREIFYDRDNKLIDDGEEVLDLFNSKKLPDMWHIMTDIDDTLYPNTEHGTFIAGSDISWKQKTAYPGIKLFYRLFYKNENCSEYSTILSATPGCLKEKKLENKLLHEILGKEYGFIQGIESKGVILSHTSDILSNCVGHLCNINKSTNANNISELFTIFGNTKFERFKQYLTLFPEYKILFIGDNGQGDVLAGLQMIKYNSNCHVFIHKVSENGIDFKKSDEEDGTIERLHFFTNYYELAKKIQDIGIFTDINVNEIKNSIEKQVKKGTSFEKLYSSLLSGGRKHKKKTKKRADKKSRNSKKHN